MNRKVLVGTALALSVGVLLWANVSKLNAVPTAGQAATQGPAGAPLVKVTEVVRGEMKQEVLAPGTVEANAAREIRAPFPSKEATLKVGIGDKVEEGQVLAELNSDDMATQVMAQEAQVVRAEAALASLRTQQQQAPLQLTQRIEQARSQLLQAQEGLVTASRQDETLSTRLDQARVSLETIQGRSSDSTAKVESARQALLSAEEAYRSNPGNPALRDAYLQAESAYATALTQSQEAAQQTAAELRRAYDELQAAEEDYARNGGENSVSVQMAQSQVESARISVQLAEMEAETGGNLAAQVRAAESDLAAARQGLDSLREKLAQAQVTAPASGTVLAVGTKDGLPVQEGQTLLSIGDLNRMKVTARVDELDIVKVKPGQSLAVRANSAPSESFEGAVTRVAAQATAAGNSQYFVVEGEVENRDGLLRSGMNAEATIATAERTDAMVIPLAAVREEADGATVLIVESFTVKERPVTLGLRTETEVEILEGLEEGEQVIVSPFSLLNSLQDGAPVRVEQLTETGGEAE